MKTIGIIGAGISGLVTAKTLKEHGFKVIIFEKETEVGGVWASSKRYPGIHTQNTKDTYAFTDFPMPKHYPEWPSGKQIQAYLESYAQHFDILGDIHFNSTVKQIKQQPDSWEIEVESMLDGTTQINKTTVDFLTICNGIHNTPNIPTHKNVEVFKANGGEIYHSSQIEENPEAFAGKKVVIVGFAKSACDIANAIAEHNADTHLIFRRTYWKVPMKFLGVLNYKYLLVNRLGESLFRYPTQFAPEKFLHGIGKPILNAIWKSLEMVFKKQCKLEKLDLVPEHPVQDLGSQSLSLTTPGFYKKVEKGAIQTHKTEIEFFTEDGMQLKDGSFVEADVVVYATGWKQEIRFMENQVVEKIRNEFGKFRLYNNILPLNVPNLTFVGYNSSLACQFTSEMAAHWTAQYIKEKLKLPAKKAMEIKMNAFIEWQETRNPSFKNSNLVSLAPFTFHYVDGLMEEMGLPIHRANPLVEWLTPFNPARYKNLTAELEKMPVILPKTPLMLPTKHSEKEAIVM